jgi:hypothetical protein
MYSASAVVRDVLAKAGKPQRMNALYQSVSKLIGPSLSKTQFRESILSGMFRRQEIEKNRVIPVSATTGKIDGPAYFELKLASTPKVRSLLEDKDGKLQSTLKTAAVERKGAKKL